LCFKKKVKGVFPSRSETLGESEVHSIIDGAAEKCGHATVAFQYCKVTGVPFLQ
jgi:hypothetical protein